MGIASVLSLKRQWTTLFSVLFSLDLRAPARCLWRQCNGNPKTLHSNQKMQHLPSPPCPPHLKGPTGRGTTAISPQTPFLIPRAPLETTESTCGKAHPHVGLSPHPSGSPSGKTSLLLLQGRAKRSGGCESCAGIHQPHADHGHTWAHWRAAPHAAFLTPGLQLISQQLQNALLVAVAFFPPKGHTEAFLHRSALTAPFTLIHKV